MGINWSCRAGCGKNGAAVAAASPPRVVAAKPGAGAETDDVWIASAGTGADVGRDAGAVEVVVVGTEAGTPVFTGCK